MKIGIDCRMFSSRQTGIGRYTFELVENLLKIDHKNHYVLFFNEAEFFNFQNPRLNASHLPTVKKILVNAHHYSFAEQLKFLKILNKEKLDLMHFTHFNAPIFYRRPSIVTIHDLTLHFFPGKKMNTFIHRSAYNLAIRNVVKKSKIIIAVSKNTKKDLEEVLKVPSEKIQTVYLGVNPEFKPIKDLKIAEPILREFSIHQPFLLYNGVWRDHKNVKGLIEAFHILKTKYQYENLQLVITGRADAVYAPAIKELVSELKLQKDVIFPGFLSDEELVIFMSQAKAYVFPSFYEGFGLPPLEAMKCHTPVAASNTSSIPEICGKENAVFFDPYKPEDIAEKIHTLLSDPELQQLLISRGAEQAKKFSWEKMAEETLKIYQYVGKKK